MSIKTHADFLGMRRIGRIVALILQEMCASVRRGMTTSELDAIGATAMKRLRARSAPQLTYRFPGFTCISVNEEIVHGVPGDRRLQPGDVVKIDVTAEHDGYIADAARTVIVDEGSPVNYAVTGSGGGFMNVPTCRTMRTDCRTTR
jgi:methionyl aminopeptidase